MGRAGSLARNHAGPERRNRSADLAEERAFLRLGPAAQNFPAQAFAVEHDVRNRAHGETPPGVKLPVLLLKLKPACGNKSQPAPLGFSWAENLLHQLHCLRIASGADRAAVFIFDLRFSGQELAQDHGKRRGHVAALEAGHDARQAEIPADEFVGLSAGYDAHVPGADETIQVQIARAQQRRHGPRHRLQGAEHKEIFQPPLRRGPHGPGYARGSRFKADRKENHLPERLGSGQLQSVRHGVHHADVGAAGPGALQGAERARHAHQVPESRRRHSGVARNHDGPVNVIGGSYTNRAPGPGNQFQAFRQERFQARAAGGDRVGAADLHDARAPAELFHAAPYFINDFRQAGAHAAPPVRCRRPLRAAPSSCPLTMALYSRRSSSVHLRMAKPA